MNPRLFEVLRQAGLSPSAEEVADALWLAQWIGVPATPTEPPSVVSMAAAPSVTAARRGGTGSASMSAAPVRQPPAIGKAPGAASATLYSADPDQAGLADLGEAPAVALVRSIGVGPTIGTREFARTLRPLRRGTLVVDSRPALDEPGTAEASARASAPSPVWQRRPARWPMLVLLVDRAPSMALWQQTGSALRTGLARLGAFRRVDVRIFDAEDPTTLHRLTTLSASVVVVFSDGVGRAWRDGTAQRLLRRVAHQSCIAVVNPLRPQLWRRTGTPASRARVLGGGGGLANAAWHMAGHGGTGAAGVPIPVLYPSMRFLAPWARMVAGETSWFSLPLLAPPTPPMPLLPMSAGERLHRFRAEASPAAFRLASLLSVVPLGLPMMQLVQRAQLASSTESDLAEVLLSGLVEQTAHDGYDFIPGIRPLLQQHLTRTEALHTVDLVATYLLPLTGALEVRALLADEPVPRTLQPLARITVSLLRAMGGPNNVLADRIVRAAADDTAERAEAGALASSGDGIDADLLIFAAARSAWFTDSYAKDTRTMSSWIDANDTGWQAAERASRPKIVEETTAGLPRRVPQQNLVPGSPINSPERPLRIVRDAAQIAAHTTGYFRGWRSSQELPSWAVGPVAEMPWVAADEMTSRVAEVPLTSASSFADTPSTTADEVETNTARTPSTRPDDSSPTTAEPPAAGPWSPADNVEQILREALRGNHQERYFRVLAGISLLLPLANSDDTLGWDTWTPEEDGRTYVLAFTSQSALRLALKQHAGATRTVTFKALANAWPNPEWWLAVNPGLPIQGYLPSWYVTQIARGDVSLPSRTPSVGRMRRI